MKQQSKLTRDDLSRIPKPKPWARILERGKYALMLLIAVLIVTNATEVKAAVPEAAKAISGTGIFRDKIFWLNWDLNGNATNGDNISSGTTRSWTSPSGIVYKATITSLTGSIVSDYANGWSGNNIIGVYDFATGITPAIKTATGGGTATFTMTVTATLPNGTIITKNNFVIAGAESLSKSSEYYQLSVPTTSKPLKLLETYIKGGNFSNFNIDITVSNNGNTLYATNLAGGDSRGDVLIGAEQVENVTVTLKGEGLQSIAIGIFEEMDFGDADNSYETNSTNTIDYARHIAVSSYSGGVLANGTIKLSGTSAKTPNSNIATLQSPVLTLGASIDTEEAKKTSASGKANGDDNDNIDDEDGLVSFLLSSNQGVFYAKNSTGKMAYCHIWIDENKNGKFDANEYIKVDVPNGTNGNLTFNPSSIGSFYSGTYYTVRLRLTTMSTLTPYGVAIDGEVEDHIVTVVHSFDDINQTPMNIPVSGNLLINDKITDKVVKPTFNGVTIPLNTETTLSKDGVTYGKITIAEDGSYTFKPETSFVGIVPPITYTGRNSTVNLDDNANLIITVVEPYSTNSNNPPIANYDTGTVKQGQSVTVKPLTNDSDPDGDAISVTNIIGRNSTGGALTLTSTPQNVYDANNVLAGQASIVSGELVFTAAATYKGEVPFTYSISDGKGGTSSSTINVTVTSTDTPTIVANDDAKAKPQGQTITGTVKDNDTWSGTNPKVTTATVTIGGTTTTLTPGTQTTISGVGKITLNSDGTYTFIPAPTFVGTVPVTYTVKNDAGVEDTATLYLTSLPAVDAKDDINQTVKGVAVSGNLLTNDDNLTKVTEVKVGSNVVSVPTSGEATLTITEGVLKVKADGTYTFTPSATFVGSVPPITYTATNAAGTATDKANLIISVTEPATASGNNPPIANHDTGTVKQGQSVTVKPLANDSDPDGDAISVTNIIGRNSTGGALTLTSTPQNVYDANNVLAGQASIVSGELVFTAEATYKGEVPFTYSISDGKGGTSSSTINVTVTSTDTPTIVANDDANSALQGVTMIGNVKNNDNWGGTQPKIVEALVVMNGVTYPLVIDASIIIPGVGTITLTKDGPYTFVPVPTFTGTVPVTYTVKNNEGVSDKATLYLTTLPFANPNYWIGTTDTDWNKTSNWTDSRLPLPYTTVEFATTANNNGNPAVNDLHVPIGTPKNVGDLINLSDKSLVVPPAASITVTGTVTGSETADKADKIKINAANDGTTPNGTFIATAACSNFDVYGTVELFAQGQKVSTPAWTDALTGSPTAGDELKSSHSWQHFGVPVEKVMALDAFKKSWIQLYNEKQNGKFQGATKPATFYDKWNFVGAYDDLFAFLGYEITQDVPKVYTIQGKLNFCDKTLNLTREAAEVNGATGVNARYGLGQNIFGNSYTAAINLDNGIEFDNAGLVEKTVYLYRTGSFQDWGANNSTVSTDTPNAGSYIAIPAMVSTTVWGNQIPSMQGFLLKFTDAATEFNPIGASVTLKYNNGGVVANSKPQLAQKAPLSHLTVTLNSKTTVDRVWLFSQEGTTDQFDNGWDGRKYFGTPTAFLYSESSFGPLQVNTSSDLNGKLLTIYPNKDSEYTLTLKKENLADYTDLHLVDLVARKVTPLTGETTTYNFTEKNSGSRVKRFMIVNSANIDFNIDQFKLLDGYLQGNDRLIVTNMTAKTGRAYLYDMAGKTVMSQVMQPSINEFPVTLKSGAYILNLDADGKQESVKLIVK